MDAEKRGISFALRLLILLAVVVGARAFLMGTIIVKGSSMEPSFVHGDVVMVNKLYKYISTPKAGDIVICRLEDGGQSESIIKRVIGLPGDEIELVMTDDYELEYDLYVNGDLMQEDYIKEPIAQSGDIEYPYIVPEDSYFIMGDNRNSSTDSRAKSIGAIPKNQLQGKAVLRFYPINRFGILK